MSNKIIIYQTTENRIKKVFTFRIKGMSLILQAYEYRIKGLKWNTTIRMYRKDGRLEGNCPCPVLVPQEVEQQAKKELMKRIKIK
jgi:hypothetical protein